MPFERHIKSLQSAYKSGNLTLYLGAGVSMGSGLPSWEKLVLSMYFKTNQQVMDESRKSPFPNYLMAISEWLLRESREPLDIIIGRLKRNFESDEDYFQSLRNTLYAPFLDYALNPIEREPYDFQANKTLESIIDLCGRSEPGKKGIKSIISYNYDDLVEEGIHHLSPEKYEAYKCVFRADQKIDRKQTPIYHVHGFIPFENGIEGSTVDELVLSEESYHKAAQDAYYWGNMIQMSSMANNVGLMIGLSLADRNIRRILSALMRTPGNRENYIILKRETPEIPTGDDLGMQFIKSQAQAHLDTFSKRGRMKLDDHRSNEFISRIIKLIMDSDEQKFKEDFAELGIHLIQVESFDEIPNIIKSIKGNGS